MITVDEALERVLARARALGSIELPLASALGMHLAEAVLANQNVPPFDQSAMDGYAICGNAEPYVIVGEVKAGDVAKQTIQDGEAMRVFTGAKVPKGTTAVVMQEMVQVNSRELRLSNPPVNGQHIRRKGEAVSPGDVVLYKGTKLNPAALGLLASLGLEKVTVVRSPNIALIVTGNELVKPGDVLIEGQIYESNSLSIGGAISALGIKPNVIYVKDDYQVTHAAIEQAILKHDMVILTGGISVGDYDFVGRVLSDLLVEEVFYKVKQKPGKPLYYGRKHNAQVFALPGNPAAALTCFYVYVLPAIRACLGDGRPSLKRVTGTMSHAFEKKGDRAHLLKATINQGMVQIHQGQSSAMLAAFVDANCLLFLSEDCRFVEVGEKVEVFLLPE